MPSRRRDRPARPPSSSRSRSPRSSGCRSGTWSSRSRCWSRARPTRRASTSRRGSTAGSAERPVDRGNDVAPGQVLVDDRQSRAADQAQGGGGGASRRRGRPRADRGRHARRSGGRAQGGAGRRPRPAARWPQQTYDRTKQLTARDFASVAEARRGDGDALDVAQPQPAAGQARLRRGGRRLHRRRARRRPGERSSRPRPPIATLQAAGRRDDGQGADRRRRSIRSAPSSASIVSPGVPLLSLVDLGDIWLRFDLREDLVKGLKVGDRFDVRVPALGDRPITVEVAHDRHARRICRMARHARDRRLRPQDLRDARLSGRQPCPSLRPGMSVYADWTDAR